MGKRIAAAWAAWKKRHWDPEHGVGFIAESWFISPGRTVYPPLRRAARWLHARWDSILEKVVVALCTAFVIWIATILWRWLRD